MHYSKMPTSTTHELDPAALWSDRVTSHLTLVLLTIPSQPFTQSVNVPCLMVPIFLLNCTYANRHPHVPSPLLPQMLAACSNPSSVMRQQQAFDQLDTRSASRTAKRQLRRGGSTSLTAAAAGPRKARKGWMALF